MRWAVATMNKGLTLLEATIALALLMIISVGLTATWAHTSSATTALISRQNAFENARGSLDVILANVKFSHSVTLTTDGNNSLQMLRLYGFNPNNEPHVYTISFDITAPSDATRFQRLMFGGVNEFSSGIGNVIVYTDDMLRRLYVTVITACEYPVVLSGTVDIRFKNVVVHNAM